MKLFSSKESKGLKQLLACAVDQDEVLNLDSLHGFLYCLAILPDVIHPSEWLSFVFGEEMLEVKDEAEANNLMGALFAAYNRLIKECDQGELVFPFDIGKLKSSDPDRIRDWAYGFFLGINLRPEVWGFPADEDYDSHDIEEEDDEQTEAAACIAVLMGVAFPDKIADLFDEPAATSEEELARAKEQEARFFVLLPQAIETFQLIAREWKTASAQSKTSAKVLNLPVRREEKIGRNDPCPCGSGKKYKKCCGG